MSDTVVTIHYQSPADDPFKVPRPTRLTVDAAGNIQTIGGEGDQLIGLSRQDPAPGGHGRGLGVVAGPPEEWDPENWVGLRDILSEGAADLELAGWYPVLRTENREWIYTLTDPVDRVEILGTDEVAEFRAES